MNCYVLTLALLLYFAIMFTMFSICSLIGVAKLDPHNPILSRTVMNKAAINFMIMALLWSVKFFLEWTWAL